MEGTSFVFWSALLKPQSEVISELMATYISDRLPGRTVRVERRASEHLMIVAVKVISAAEQWPASSVINIYLSFQNLAPSHFATLISPLADVALLFRSSSSSSFYLFS